MKEIISAVLLVVSIYGGTCAIKIINNGIRKAALVKASQGLPSLLEMNRALREGKRK